MASTVPSDRRFLFGVTVVLTLLTSLPYLYGWLRQTPELTYLGLHGFAPGDPMVYASYLWQARDGRLLFSDLYTTEIPRLPILNTFWAVAGWLGWLLQLSVPLTFQGARITAAVFAVGTLWWWLHPYVGGAPRRWALLLIVFGSGISGYLLPLFAPDRGLPGYYHLPMDLWVAEFSFFTSALHSGHLVAALALIAVIFGCAVQSVATKRWRYDLAGGVAAFALFSFHPFHVPLVFAVLAVWAVALVLFGHGVRALRYLLVVAGMSLPVLGYYAVALSLDPVTVARTARNLTLTPAPYFLPLALGWLLPAGVIGIRRLWRSGGLRQPRWLLLLIWAVAQIVLMFLPWISYQRRMVTAVLLPWAVFAVYGWPAVAAWTARRWGKLVAGLAANALAAGGLALALFGFSNLVNLGNDLGLMQQRHPLVFWPTPQVEAIAALRQYADADAVVLAHPLTSYLIPGFTGRRVVAGHQDVETLDYEGKVLEVVWFYQGSATPERRREFLERYGVTHVFAGPRERAVGLDALPYLTPVYANGTVTIYRVER